MISSLKGLRTYLIGWAIIIASMLVQAADTVGVIDISSFLPPQYAPLGPMIVAFVMVAMRRITTTPPGRSGS